jgi:hypothetical protein
MSYSIAKDFERVWRWIKVVGLVGVAAGIGFISCCPWG